jgi:rhodanese-related sulfurtransferase
MVTKYSFKIILLFFVFILNVIELKSDNKMTNFEITINKAFQSYTKNELVIIDIRTVKEWKMTGVIPQSYLINMHTENFSENPDFLSEVELVLNKLKNKNIAFICASGARSEIVANYFIEKNYKNISHIPVGIVGKENNGWLYLGHPIKSYDEESKVVN